MSSINAFKSSLDYALSNLFASKMKIFIEQMVFMDGTFWLRFRFGSSMKIHKERIEVVHEQYGAPFFNEIQWAKFNQYLSFYKTYQNFIKFQCPESQANFIEFVMKEVQDGHGF
ncbi:hypothetical protein D5018_07025 [Parashewanella curva]|uniref:Uncharacterized protein n=1 Tax=Parashewanella curva TaxID=2338552 RepID=A0A3L8Q105_9GAMM|nr:hypothetical protein [Parashewanella curva]RLV60403.1 hypothetical protein D5018_07025 [Parashewanella curva]